MYLITLACYFADSEIIIIDRLSIVMLTDQFLFS